MILIMEEATRLNDDEARQGEFETTNTRTASFGHGKPRQARANATHAGLNSRPGE